MDLLKLLDLKWLENVQMRGGFVSAQTTGVLDSAQQDGVQVQKLKALGERWGRRIGLVQSI